MDNMAEERRKMHERAAKNKEDSKKTSKKIKNFFFGCCKNK